MKYEWDEDKAARNFYKHKVSFTAAANALDDPNRIDYIDDQMEYGEERWRSLCMTHGVVLFVVTTMRDMDVCRIISARKATQHEEHAYFEGDPLFPPGAAS